MRNFSALALAATLLAMASPAAAVSTTAPRFRDADAPPRRRYTPPKDTALQREIAEHNARVEAAKDAKRIAKRRRTQEGEKP